MLSWFGYALLALNLVALAVNPFNGCFYYFDAGGNYQTGRVRDLVFAGEGLDVQGPHSGDQGR